MLGIDIEKAGIIASVIVSIVSLIISIRAFRLKAPKLRISIMNKACDCFFGLARPSGRNDNSLLSYISGVRFRITNNSPVDISIVDVKIRIRKETYSLIDKTNPYWGEIEFLFVDKDGDYTTDGSAIFYANEGISTPCDIKSYNAINAIALFYHFPKSIKGKVKATLVVYTGIGKRRKHIELVEYNDEYANLEFLDVAQYERSIEYDKK